MPFTIELVDKDGMPFDVPPHRESYRSDPSPTNVTTNSVVHLSNMATDVACNLFDHFGRWNEPTPNEAVAYVVVLKALIFGTHDEETPDILPMLVAWALAHPEGRWRAA
jgi:hypothetical protein